MNIRHYVLSSVSLINLEKRELYLEIFKTQLFEKILDLETVGNQWLGFFIVDTTFHLR